jgi:hypothetical protein
LRVAHGKSHRCTAHNFAWPLQPLVELLRSPDELGLLERGAVSKSSDATRLAANHAAMLGAGAVAVNRMARAATTGVKGLAERDIACRQGWKGIGSADRRKDQDTHHTRTFIQGSKRDGAEPGGWLRAEGLLRAEAEGSGWDSAAHGVVEDRPVHGFIRRKTRRNLAQILAIERRNDS